MSNQDNQKDNSKIFCEAFSKFLDSKRNNFTKDFDAINLDPIEEEYYGVFEKKLKMILGNKPLTFYNLHQALKDNKLSHKKIQRIIHRIDCQKEKTDAINKLFLECNISKSTLKHHLASKIILPTIFILFIEFFIALAIVLKFKNSYILYIFFMFALLTIFLMYHKNKFYQDLKKSIKSSEQFLSSRYNIRNNANMQKLLNHSKNRSLLVGKLNKLQHLKLQERNLIILSIKKLIKKIRTNVISLYPEFKPFVKFLSYDELSNLKILREQFNFSPNSIEDFTREIRNCKIIMKKNPSLAKYYKLKIRLLESVSAEFYKNLTHSKNLEKGYTFNINTNKTIHF